MGRILGGFPFLQFAVLFFVCVSVFFFFFRFRLHCRLLFASSVKSVHWFFVVDEGVRVEGSGFLGLRVPGLKV